MWRAAVSAALAVLSVALTGCGEEEPATETARYLDPRSDAVIAISLDYDDGNWQQIKRLYARAVQVEGVADDGFVPPTLDALLGTAAVGSAGLSFADDVRPLLGGTLQIGVRVEPVEREQAGFTTTLAYQVPDAEALDRVLAKLREQGVEPKPMPGVEDAVALGGGAAVVGGDTLVAVADDAGEDDADAALRERLAADGAGPELPELGDDLVAARLAPGLLGAWLNRGELERALGTPAGRALRGVEARLRVADDAARVSARVDFDGLAPEELPLPGPGPLELPPGEPLASASTDQSLTTVFLARLARELYPDSRFVRRVERLEQREGLRFEDEVLRQFSGPSVTVLRPGRDGEVAFGARSTLRDPGAMRELLERIAPDLPGILEGLQGLGTTGLASLLFVAPDAPLTPSALGLLAAIDVRRLAGGASEDLYEITGLDEDGARPGPDRVVYGLIGDAFVVASSAELAREVAAMRTEPAEEAATRIRADVAPLAEDAAAWLGDDAARVIGALVEVVEASASAEDGDVVAEAEARWRR